MGKKGNYLEKSLELLRDDIKNGLACKAFLDGCNNQEFIDKLNSENAPAIGYYEALRSFIRDNLVLCVTKALEPYDTQNRRDRCSIDGIFILGENEIEFKKHIGKTKPEGQTEKDFYTFYKIKADYAYLKLMRCAKLIVRPI